ncbi:MAG: hypothetical protein V1735_02740 [Nanoarchaeota archaeon]
MRTERLFLAFTVALAWVVIARDWYDYGWGPAGILFPLLAWSACLFLLSFGLHLRLRPWPRMAVIFLCYWILLIGIETFGYHALGVRNLRTIGYPGLPLCDCLHAPLFMQAAYFALGPAYILLLHIAEPKNLK